jgi:hypothetical protein
LGLGAPPCFSVALNPAFCFTPTRDLRPRGGRLEGRLEGAVGD